MKTTVHNGKYKLIEKLGSGATSLVYKAERVSDAQVCAVKILRHEYVSDEESVKRFMREADALMKLHHQNVVEVYDFGSEDDTFYIVMEYVEGETLKRVIRSAGTLPEDTVIIVALQLCNALKQAHDNGVIHRDIKPQNILVTVEGVVKIADFGIARVNAGSTLTALGKDILGSVHYISPEQARGSYLDKRSDIYSLGVTLYEMATGTLPFMGEDPLNVAMRHVNETAIPVRDVNPKLSQALSNIIEKCMSKDPNNRYNDVSELKSDLIRATKQPDGAYVVLHEDPADDMPTRKMRVDDLEERIIASGEPVSEESVVVSEEENKKKVIKMAVLITVALALVIGVVSLFVLVFQRNRSGNVSVPSVVGMTETQAIQLLRDSDLRVTTDGVYDAKVPQGKVVKQKPAAGTDASAKDLVTITISLGAEPVTPSPYIDMPDLKNKTEQEARYTLRNLGLEVTFQQVNSDAKIGTVIEQDISPGTQLMKGDTVTVTVSSGALIPALSRLTPEQAKSKAEEAGYTIGNITPVVSADLKGKVVSQTPEANKIIDASGGKPVIDITVGKFTQVISIYESDYIGGRELLIFHTDENNQTVIDMTLIISPGEIPPDSLSVDSITAGSRTYSIMLDGILIREVNVAFN